MYEGIAVRLASGRNLRRQAFRTAVIANPIGRAIGVAMVSGGALRYRMYAPEGLTIKQVGAVILLVAMPYVFGVGWLIDLSLLLHLERCEPRVPVAVRGRRGLRRARTRQGRRAGSRSSRRARSRSRSAANRSACPRCATRWCRSAFGLVQISLMTTILYLFMPAELNMTWPAFVAIYCIAFVAGQLSNVPAGLGVLEAALFLMLPQVPPGKLVGAVLAYRAVYELVPLGVALLLLLIYETTNQAGIIRKRFRTSGSSP